MLLQPPTELKNQTKFSMPCSAPNFVFVGVFGHFESFVSPKAVFRVGPLSKNNFDLYSYRLKTCLMVYISNLLFGYFFGCVVGKCYFEENPQSSPDLNIEFVNVRKMGIITQKG